MPQENGSDTLTFKSEAERNEALAQMPDEPPIGADVEKWQDEQEQRFRQLNEAQIVPDESTGDIANVVSDEAVPTEVPTPTEGSPPATHEEQKQDQEQTESQSSNDQVVPDSSQISPQVSAENAEQPNEEDEYMDFGRIKKSDIPEYLRKYGSPGEILKQAEHSRKHTDRLHELFQQKEAEHNRLKLEIDELKKKQKAELESYKSAQEKTVASQKATKQEQSEAKRSIPEIEDAIKALDTEDLEDLPAIKNVGKALKALNEQNAEWRQKYEDMTVKNEAWRNEIEEKARIQETRANELRELEQKRIDEENRRKAVENVEQELTKLVNDNPELRTSKPLIGSNGVPTVEADMIKFVDRIAFEKFNRSTIDWAERNKLFNAYLRKDQDVYNFCQQNGITPESVTTSSENDFKAYATIAEVDAHMRGMVTDPYTGERKTRQNPLTNSAVTFPDYKTAYADMLRTKGISQQKIQNDLIEAEKQGQQNLESAISRGTNAPKVLASQSGTTAGVVDKEMTKEQALRLVNDDDFMYKVQESAMRGDRRNFDMLNSAYKTLGWPLSSPEETWPDAANTA